MTHLRGTGALRGLRVPRTGHVGRGGLGGLAELARLGPKIKYVRFVCRLNPPFLYVTVRQLSTLKVRSGT